MQIKKRAKAVKFGRKLDPPKTEANLPAGRQGVKPPTKKPEVEKEEKIENSVEIILETQSEEVQVNPSPSKEKGPEQKDESTSKSPNPAQTGEKENKTTPNAGQDQLIPITQNSDTIADTPSVSETTKEENIEEQKVIPTGSEQPSDSTNATLGGDTYIVEKEVKKNMLGYFWLIAIISFVVGLLSMAALNFFLPNAGMSAGIFFFSKPIAASPTPKPTSTPSPTAKVLNLAEFSIEILNGSGITGEATKLKELLVTDGFKVSTVGNADSSDYTDTIIFAKKNVSAEYLINLKEKLNKTYTLGADVKTPTGATSEADIIITIGSNTANN